MISVIIPAYNVENYIERCISSLINQTYNNWECIIIDDGSEDNTWDLCERFMRSCPQIKAVQQKRQGVSAARNKGIDLATGSHILFVDADDCLDKTMLEMLSLYIGEHDIAVCGYNKVVIKEEKDYVQEINPWKQNSKEIFISTDLFYDILCKTAVLWNKLFTRDIISGIRFDTDQSYGEDASFVFNILKRAKSAVIIQKPLYNYFINRPGNVVSSSIDERSINLLDNTIKIYDELANSQYASCGIYRICVSVSEILRKTNKANGLEKKKYEKYCIKAIKHPQIKDRFMFIRDQKILYQKRITYLFLSLMPHVFLSIRRMRTKGRN